MEFIREGNAYRKYDDNGKMVAEVLFPEENGRLNITRTYVDDSLRGQQIAAKLVQKVVDLAKEENKKITPSCSYAVKWFDKNIDMQKLIK